MRGHRRGRQRGSLCGRHDPLSRFPVTPGAFDPSYNSDDPMVDDTYMAKLNTAGSALDYATFLGGTGWELIEALAVDGGGAAYVTGFTDSSTFPLH